ncbi:MAG: hypothetical protein AB8H80_19850 [Planctomycetota bacterium]
MTGDNSHSNDRDDSDFLDEDFVVEDIAGKNDDLEDLFDTEPGSVVPELKPPSETDSAEESVLFEDHTDGLKDEVQFHKSTFEEEGVGQWDGSLLDLENVGVPSASIEEEERAADPQMAEAEESFAAELDSMLQSDDDFAIESTDEEKLLEESFDDDGIAEFEQSGPFVLDDGDGLWSEELEDSEDSADSVLEVTGLDDSDGDASVLEVAGLDDAESDSDDVSVTGLEALGISGLDRELGEEADSEAAEAVGEQPFVEDAFAEETAAGASDSAFTTSRHVFGDELAAADDGMELVGADVNAEHGLEDGLEDGDEDHGMQLLESTVGADADEELAEEWQPLPEQNVDDLSEVDDVERTDDEDGFEAYDEDDSNVEPAYASADGHDIYEEHEDEDELEVVGGYVERRRGGLFLSIAASLLLLVGVSSVILRPEWFGLRVEPERVASIDMTRPSIDLTVTEPPKPSDVVKLAGAGVGDENDGQGSAALGDDPEENGGSNQLLGGGAPTGTPAGIPTGNPGDANPNGEGQPDTHPDAGGSPEAAVVANPVANPETSDVPGMPVEPGEPVNPGEPVESGGGQGVAGPLAQGTESEANAGQGAGASGENAGQDPREPNISGQDPLSTEPSEPESNPVAGAGAGTGNGAAAIVIPPTEVDPAGSDPGGTAGEAAREPSDGQAGRGAVAVAEPTGDAGGDTGGNAATGGSTSGNPAADADPAGGNPATAVTPLGPDGWPLAAVTKSEIDPAPAAQEPKPLARFGDGLLVGEQGAIDGQVQAMDGVAAGSRAFAQLHNGNYFIGQVKSVAGRTITLRVKEGEVTLHSDDIAQLTQLGSSDYDELQRVTKGFVRLTNNNRLVGGILSKIADDHVVLEFRRNRVMLPKSLVGEIVSGEQDNNKVRLGTTVEEDDWVRDLAERELGTGRGAEPGPGLPRVPQTTVKPRTSGPPK